MTQTTLDALLAEIGAQTDITLDDSGETVVAGLPPLPELLAANTIAPLPYWSFLQVAGPDAGKFLQGQLTCDVAAIGADRATPGAHCTPKGRMLASYLLTRPAQDTFWLRVRRDICAGASAALGKYIVFSKARLAPRDDLLALGINGPEAAAGIAAFAGAVPEQQYAAVAAGGGTIIQLDTEGLRFEAWLVPDEAAELWRECADFRTVGSAFWRWLDIRAGFASVSAATVEAFLPQMLDYDRNGGVSFTKGCYTGQEIVARTHYRGQVKRHLLRAELSAPAPAAGTELIDAGGRTQGTVVEAVDRGDGTSELLAVVSGDGQESANLRPTGGEAALRVL